MLDLLICNFLKNDSFKYTCVYKLLKKSFLKYLIIIRYNAIFRLINDKYNLCGFIIRYIIIIS